MKLGGKMVRLRESYRKWKDAGGEVTITSGDHLRWSLDGKLAFFSGQTSSVRHARNVAAKVRKHLAVAKPAR